jgi:hypothetical protein
MSTRSTQNQITKYKPLAKASIMPKVEVSGPPFPRDIDILCGNADETKTHPGNLVFNYVVAKHADGYRHAKDRRAKMAITDMIYRMLVDEMGARFLKRDPYKEVWYIVKTERVGKDKISHSLRSLARGRGVCNKTSYAKCHMIDILLDVQRPRDRQEKPSQILGRSSPRICPNVAPDYLMGCQVNNVQNLHMFPPSMKLVTPEGIEAISSIMTSQEALPDDSTAQFPFVLQQELEQSPPSASLQCGFQIQDWFEQSWVDDEPSGTNRYSCESDDEVVLWALQGLLEDKESSCDEASLSIPCNSNVEVAELFDDATLDEVLLA